MFILPCLDSIFGFIILYIVVIGIPTWVSRASPRLSYFGNQLAVAYCLIAGIPPSDFTCRCAGLRERLRGWQPQLRALFVMRIAALKYRLEAPGFEIPQAVSLRQQAYDEASARVLDEMANRIEGHAPSRAEEDNELLQRTLAHSEAEARRALPADRARSLVAVVHGIDNLTSSLAAEIAADLAQ